MTAVDTNILVYAHRADSEWHDRATACLRALAEGRADWAIPWPCLHEFVATVTHLRIFNPPSTVDQAIDQVEAWMESPSLTLLGEPHDHWPLLRRHLLDGHVQGPAIHDARVPRSASGTACANFSRPTATLTASRRSGAGIRSSRRRDVPGRRQPISRRTAPRWWRAGHCTDSDCMQSLHGGVARGVCHGEYHDP